MGWLKNRDGSLDWQAPDGSTTTHVSPERAVVVEAQWAEERRRREGGAEPATAMLTEQDIRDAYSQPSARHQQAMADLAVERAYEDQHRLARERADADVARVSTGGRR